MSQARSTAHRFARAPRLALGLWLLATTACLPGCLGVPEAVEPIPTTTWQAPSDGGRNLLVMLPGRGDRMDVFADHGFPEIALDQGFDVVAVDAHFGYYMRRSLLPLLRDDIIAPARARGYTNIWLLGVSMGGFGALLYSAEYPDEIDGLVLLAPYLGDRKISASVTAAGGLDAWQPESARFKDYEVQVWAWLKANAGVPGGTPVQLGYGREDRLAAVYPPLRERLPEQQLLEIDGGHGWGTWTPLWRELATGLRAD